MMNLSLDSDDIIHMPSYMLHACTRSDAANVHEIRFRYE